jgi:hypothetical protein
LCIGLVFARRTYSDVVSGFSRTVNGLAGP